MKTFFQIRDNYLKGGPGSGHFGHAGRPGKKGGSSKGGSQPRNFSSDNPEDAVFGADLLSKEQSEWENSLTVYDINIIDEYTDTNISSEVNTYLLRGYTNEIPEEDAIAISERLHEIISRNKTKEDFIVYRGVGEKLYNSLKNKDIGDKFLWKGFTSTSLAERYASWMGQKPDIPALKIIVSKGTEGAYIGRIGSYPGEYEFLINSGTMFEIVDNKSNQITLRTVLSK